MRGGRVEKNMRKQYGSSGWRLSGGFGIKGFVCVSDQYAQKKGTYVSV